MSPEEMEEFLSRSNIAMIATVKPDRSPHVTPVWYAWENNQLLMSTAKGTVKERNLKQNKKVAVVIHSSMPPHKAVIIEGIAEVEDSSEQVERRICERYVEAENLEEYIEYSKANWQSILIRVYPERISTWDYSKDPFLSRLHLKM